MYKYDWELNLPDVDWESKCFTLVPYINTYSELEVFCKYHNLNCQTWYDLYKSLLTVYHFGINRLENHQPSSIDKLKLVEHPDDTIEVFDLFGNKLGNITKIADIWINDRFDDFDDIFSAAMSYMERPMNEFGW